MELKLVKLEFPEGCNIILGQTHFIKSVEDTYEALINAVPGIKFGLAFCEASGERLIRKDGTDEELINIAVKNMENIAAGHTFVIILKNAFPINVLSNLKQCWEIVNIFCATANPTELVIAESEQGRGIMGVIDGFTPLGVESDEYIKARKDLLRTIGYKR